MLRPHLTRLSQRSTCALSLSSTMAYESDAMECMHGALSIGRAAMLKVRRGAMV